jgi:hypothetical protein
MEEMKTTKDKEIKTIPAMKGINPPQRFASA